MNLNISIEKLCKVVEGESTLDPSFLIQNINSLESAGNDDLAVIFDPEDNSVFPALSLEKIQSSNAGVMLASKPVVDGKSYVIVKDPVVAFEKLAIYMDECVNDLIHPSAIIESTATIGENTCIGANVYIGHGVRIGNNVLLHPGVQVLQNCIVGDGTIIHAGVVIGSDGFGYRVMKTGMRKIPHVGIVRIGSQVEIGANTTIDRALFGETIIGDGVKIDNLVHIAHNVQIGASTAILALTGIAGSVTIGAGCQIGGQVVIRDHITIGNQVKIVSKSAVMKSIPDGQVVCGIPSVSFSQWKRTVVAINKLPDYVRLLRGIQGRFDKKEPTCFFSKIWQLLQIGVRRLFNR